jgi:hypothetical protein
VCVQRQLSARRVGERERERESKRESREGV